DRMCRRTGVSVSPLGSSPCAAARRRDRRRRRQSDRARPRAEIEGCRAAPGERARRPHGARIRPARFRRRWRGSDGAGAGRGGKKVELGLPDWARAVIGLSALMQFVFAVTLLLDPTKIASVWPWPIPPLTARLLGASTLVSVPMALLTIA